MSNVELTNLEPKPNRNSKFDIRHSAPISSLLLAGDSSASPVASVLVPAGKTGPIVKDCLAYLVRQEMDEPFEIIVATEEDHPLISELSERFPKVRIAFCAPGCGPGGARNAAIAAARGEYLAFTDTDCFAERDWLRTLLAACRRHGGRAICGWIANGFPSALCAAVDLAERGIARPSEPQPLAGLWGANMCIPRQFLPPEGSRFAEGVYGAEEMFLYQRLPQAALPVMLEPSASVRHMRQDSLREALARMADLGAGSAKIRRRIALRGSFFARHSCLAPLLVPLRLAMTARRTWGAGAGAFWQFLKVSPLVLCLLTAYTIGFMRQARAEGRGQSEIQP